jgi:hypothetical protein
MKVLPIFLSMDFTSPNSDTALLLTNNKELIKKIQAKADPETVEFGTEIMDVTRSGGFDVLEATQKNYTFIVGAQVLKKRIKEIIKSPVPLFIN